MFFMKQCLPKSNAAVCVRSAGLKIGSPPSPSSFHASKKLSKFNFEVRTLVEKIEAKEKDTLIFQNFRHADQVPNYVVETIANEMEKQAKSFTGRGDDFRHQSSYSCSCISTLEAGSRAALSTTFVCRSIWRIPRTRTQTTTCVCQFNLGWINLNLSSSPSRFPPCGCSKRLHA